MCKFFFPPCTAHWVVVPCRATWSARQGHAAAAFDGCVLVFGGFDESGYCNTAYRLRISTSARAGCFPFIMSLLKSQIITIFAFTLILESQLLKRKTADGNSQGNGENNRPQKILTVSITCVMNTVRTLQMKRSRHEYLVQALINILALVMSAVRPSNPEAVSDKAATPSHSEWQIDGGDVTITTDAPGPSYKLGLSLEVDTCGLDSPMTSGSMGKVGSPFRENFLQSRQATSLNSYSAMLKRDFQSQLFDVSAALSPNNRRSIVKASSRVWGRNRDEDLLNTGRESRKQSTDSVDEIGIQILPSFCSSSEGVETAADSGEKESLSSALLHDNMEKYRRDLSNLQHQIRCNAEQDRTTEMNTSIAERNSLANKAFKEVMGNIVPETFVCSLLMCFTSYEVALPDYPSN